jgi:hypothetical protein
MRKVWREIQSGQEWIVDGDLKDFFGSVDHEKLLTLVAQRIADSRVLGLIRAMLKAGSYGQGRLFPTERGTPPVGLIQSASLLGRGRTGISLIELIHLLHPFLFWSSFLFPTSLSAAFPNPFRCRLLGHKLSLASGTTQQSDYWQSTASHFAFAYRVTSFRATEGSTSPPEVTHHSSVSCRPQSPCLWWVNENAFASIQQARPCPTPGRPVHLRVAPLDYGPILLLRPFGFHFTADTLPSGIASDGFRSVLAVSGFRLRARLDFSIAAKQ